jgi:glycine/D-amino acid oxidase-like deaminating enzyme
MPPNRHNHHSYALPQHVCNELSAVNINAADEDSRERVEVAVVGGGQAGLAMGYYLACQGRRFVILERADSIAPAWRERWDSLKLFTPRGYSSLPGLPFPGDPDDYPTRDEVIAYLEQYAEEFDLPIELNSPVRRLSREDGRFVLELDTRTITADQIVAATGPFQTPYVPKLAEELDPTSGRRTARATDGRVTYPREPCSWSGAGTRASRSPRSSRPRPGSSSRSALVRSRCRSGWRAATSSGG